jgi:hypothetical protein
MKPTFLMAAFLISVLTAGCDNPSSTTGESKPAVTQAPAKSPNPPGETQVAQRPKVDWHNHGRSGKADENLPVQAPESDANNQAAAKQRVEMEEEPPPEKDPPIPEAWKALNKDKTLFFEKTANGQRRVHLVTQVCLREGQLEVLICKANTKEHESILHIDIDARDIHTALIAAGAKPGTTVKFVPEYKAATGDIIRVTLTYYKDGKLLSNKPAQTWIQHVKTLKDMEHDWVFAGSRLFKFPDEPDKPPYYCANNGEVVSIANFTDSMLDLPVMSSKEAAELGYVANKERIPPLKTKVIVTLEVLKKG